MKTLRNLRRSLSFFLYFLNVLLFFGCAAKTPQPLLYPEPLPPLAYKFDYTPIKEASSISGTIAIVSPTFAKSPESPAVIAGDIDKISGTYLDNLKSDFEETLISKGFSLLGPFSDLEAMTFGEKDKAILALVPSVTLSYRFENSPNESVFSSSDVGAEKRIAFGYDAQEHYFHRIEEIVELDGQIIADGHIDLTLYEPLTKEKLWVKQIQVPFEIQPYKAYLRRIRYELRMLWGEVVNRQDGSVELLPAYDSRPRACAKALESVYVSQLSQFSRYFDPKEIALVIKDAEKARKLKRL